MSKINKSSEYLGDPVVLTPEEEERLKKLEVLSDWMDSRFVIPGTKLRFGLDAILGLVPGIGDTITTLISAYLIKEAHMMNAPFKVKAKMAINIGLDWLSGLLPVVGDLFDVGFKANNENIKILKKYLEGRK